MPHGKWGRAEDDKTKSRLRGGADTAPVQAGRTLWAIPSLTHSWHLVKPQRYPAQVLLQSFSSQLQSYPSTHTTL